MCFCARAYESSDDAYRVFRKIRLSGDLIGRRPAWQDRGQAPAGDGAGLVYCYANTRGISGVRLCSDRLHVDELKKFGITQE